LTKGRPANGDGGVPGDGGWRQWWKFYQAFGGAPPWTEAANTTHTALSRIDLHARLESDSIWMLSTHGKIKSSTNAGSFSLSKTNGLVALIIQAGRPNYSPGGAACEDAQASTMWQVMKLPPQHQQIFPRVRIHHPWASDSSLPTDR
jgi:hypothetical protein